MGACKELFDYDLTTLFAIDCFFSKNVNKKRGCCISDMLPYIGLLYSIVLYKDSISLVRQPLFELLCYFLKLLLE